MEQAAVRKLDGKRREGLQMARQRLIGALVIFAVCFSFLALRALDLGLAMELVEVTKRDRTVLPQLASRSEIIDRNGVVLATNMEMQSLSADPRQVKDAAELTDRLVKVMPDLNYNQIYNRLTSSAKFVWIKRQLTPEEVYNANAIGDPALQFHKEEKRVYPKGALAAHVLGYVGVDRNGLGGIERYMNDRLSDEAYIEEPYQLSLDVRIQHALEDEMMATMQKHEALGGAGLVMDVRTGEVLAMASLPDFDPNNASASPKSHFFNRATQGVYELGSTFKTFTVAQGLDDGTITLNSRYDATEPLRIGRFRIHDDHPQKRWLNVPEIYAYSSNIGAARIVDDIGYDEQQMFMRDLGLLSPASIELSEVGAPLLPERWSRVQGMTISYGHGLAVSPVQLGSAIASMVNGGFHNPATLVRNDDNQQLVQAKQVISSKTSAQIRRLMRLVVEEGTGSQADVAGYLVGGKTGTAEKSVAGGYNEKAVMASFVGVFPMDDPRYLVFTIFDEPKGTKDTFNFVGGGWVSAPTVGRVIARIAPMLGVKPRQKPKGFQTLSLPVVEENLSHE